jgi:hypothetical protein
VTDAIKEEDMTIMIEIVAAQTTGDRESATQGVMTTAIIEEIPVKTTNTVDDVIIDAATALPLTLNRRKCLFHLRRLRSPKVKCSR